MKPILETERLTLREANLDDAAFLLELLNSPGWLQYIGDRGVKNLADARQYLSNRILKSYTDHGFGLYLMVRKEDQVSLGMCGLIRREGLGDIDIGFALLPEYMGQGYAFEAAAAVMAYARDDLKLERIVAITLPVNTNSIRLLENTRVDAYFSDAATRPATVVNLAFEAPLRAELTIADMTEEDLWDLWEHPVITFEDPVFDDALLVRGVEHFARSVLSAECRAALLELRLACDHLRIDRERLTVMVLGSRIRAPRLSALLDLVEAAGRHLLPGKQRKDRAYR